VLGLFKSFWPFADLDRISTGMAADCTQEKFDKYLSNRAGSSEDYRESRAGVVCMLFFYQDIPVFNLKIPYKDHTPYRYTLVGYRRQPYHQTKYKEDPKKHEKSKTSPWVLCELDLAAGDHQ